mgnify:CR=1 FL=1
MGLTEILGQLLQSLSNLLPRTTAKPVATEVLVVDSMLLPIHETSRAVAYLPFLSNVTTYPTAPVTLDLAAQSLHTADGVSLYINATAVYTIEDPTLLHTTLGFDEYEEIVSAAIRKTIQAEATKLTREEIVSNGVLFEVPCFTDSGIRVNTVFIEDITFPFMHRGL